MGKLLEWWATVGAKISNDLKISATGVREARLEELPIRKRLNFLDDFVRKSSCICSFVSRCIACNSLWRPDANLKLN